MWLEEKWREICFCDSKTYSSVSGISSICVNKEFPNPLGFLATKTYLTVDISWAESKEVYDLKCRYFKLDSSIKLRSHEY